MVTLSALFLIVTALAPVSPSSIRTASAEMQGPGAAVPRTGFEPSSASAPCSNTSLGSILVSPLVATVSASASQTFTARSLSTCGTDLTNLTNFSWRLSSASVGTLGSSSGPTVVYTACVAPMDGVLHVVGILGSAYRSVNATIRIGGGAFGDLPGTPAAPIVGNASSSPLSRQVGVVLVGVLLLGGVFVILWGMRSRPRRRTP